MGERAHLCRQEHVGLATHVDDVVAVLEFETLRDVVLCGASYGGMPVTGAADQVADRIRLVQMRRGSLSAGSRRRARMARQSRSARNACSSAMPRISPRERPTARAARMNASRSRVNS